MDRSTCPTEAQKGFLDSRHIVPPPTKESCSCLIGYIRNGNFTVGKGESDRIALVIAAQKRWLGRRIQAIHSDRSYSDKPGLAVYVTALTTSEVRDIRRAGWNGPLSPFRVRVNFDDGSYGVVPPSQIRLRSTIVESEDSLEGWELVSPEQITEIDTGKLVIRIAADGTRRYFLPEGFLKTAIALAHARQTRAQKKQEATQRAISHRETADTLYCTQCGRQHHRPRVVPLRAWNAISKCPECKANPRSGEQKFCRSCGQSFVRAQGETSASWAARKKCYVCTPPK